MDKKFLAKMIEASIEIFGLPELMAAIYQYCNLRTIHYRTIEFKDLARAEKWQENAEAILKIINDVK